MLRWEVPAPFDYFLKKWIIKMSECLWIGINPHFAWMIAWKKLSLFRSNGTWLWQCGMHVMCKGRGVKNLALWPHVKACWVRVEREWKREGLIDGWCGSECHEVVINSCQCQPMYPSLMCEEQSHVYQSHCAVATWISVGADVLSHFALCPIPLLIDNCHLFVICTMSCVCVGFISVLCDVMW